MQRTLRTAATALVAMAAVVGAAAFIGARSEAQSSAASATERPAVIAVKFHADWCGFCKAMGPVFEELQAKFDQQPALYIVFDQTREFDRRQSEYLASALGLEHVWAKHGGQTGFVLLIDAATGKVVDKLTHERSLKEMGAALQAAVARAGS